MAIVSMNKGMSSFKKDEYIFREGDMVHGIYFIQNGAVKVISDTLHGRQQIVRLSKRGNILGYRALGKNVYYFNAIAFSDATLCFIDNETYHSLCKINNDLTYNLMLQYAHELGRTGLRMKFQAQMNAREKIAEAFVYLYETYGMIPGTNKLNIAYSRQDLTDLAGSSFEQISRQIAEFEKEGILAKQKREIEILDLDKLKDIVQMYKIE